jgi:hypothetical protein
MKETPTKKLLLNQYTEATNSVWHQDKVKKWTSARAFAIEPKDAQDSTMSSRL